MKMQTHFRTSKTESHWPVKFIMYAQLQNCSHSVYGQETAKVFSIYIYFICHLWFQLHLDLSKLCIWCLVHFSAMKVTEHLVQIVTLSSFLYLFWSLQGETCFKGECLFKSRTKMQRKFWVYTFMEIFISGFLLHVAWALHDSLINSAHKK